MSSPEKDDVFMKLAEEDGKILEELENVHEDYEKTLEIMERRFSLFREYAAQSTDPVVTEIILTQAQLNKLERVSLMQDTNFKQILPSSLVV
ncbi:MAG: hypothetical protein WAL23_01305 [Nitrososphaeraceae archaeon]